MSDDSVITKFLIQMIMPEKNSRMYEKMRVRVLDSEKDFFTIENKIIPHEIVYIIV